MCRILLGYAEGGGVGLLARLVELHVKASEWDPLLAKLTGGDGRHCHGYGYVALLDRGWGWSLYHEKFDAADVLGVGEASCRANLDALRSAASRLTGLVRGSRRILLLLHSRKASRGTPRGTLHAHPYSEPIHKPLGPGLLYVAHNGSVRHQEIADHLGLHIDPRRYTDTHILALLLAKRLSEGASLEGALREGAAYVRSAYIVGAILAGPGGVEAAYSAILSPGVNEDRARYYEPYIMEAPGLKALVSPTIAELAFEDGLQVRARRALETGRLYSDYDY